VYYVSGGFLEIQPGTVHILADTATRADDVDEDSAIRAQQEAVDVILKQTGEMDYAAAASQLAQAAAQIRTLQQLRRKLGK